MLDQLDTAWDLAPAAPRTDPRSRAALGLLILILCAAPPLTASDRAEAATDAGGPPPGAGPVVVEGEFGDWDGIVPLYQAGERDRLPAELGIEAVWGASDRDRLSVRVKLSSETILQRDSGLVLYLDTDDSAETGTAVDGLGADLVWRFSDREGRLLVMGLPIRITQSAVGLRQAPSIASSEFELSLARGISAAGAPLFPHPAIALALHVESPGSPGSVLDTTGRLALDLSDAPRSPAPTASLARDDPRHLRVLTYNVLFDGCFERPEPFRRILRALDPDILSLQEIYLHSVDETRAWIEGVWPGSAWHSAGSGQGIILSRFPVRDWGPVGTERRGAWAVLDTPDGPLVLINPHPPCCENDAGRQQEFDAIAAWIREARSSGRIKKATPILIAGDMNLVGESRQLATLLRGDIADTTTYGPAAAPDGDGTALADPLPYHLSGTEAYTWRGDDGPFAPGRLDYIVYTDSCLGLGRAFVLWTPELPAHILEAAGLHADDTAVASDHLPVVADFYFRAPASSR